MAEAGQVEQLFLTFSRERLQLLASRISDCLSRLSDEQIWQRGSEVENSVANLVLHLCGNVRQWIISVVGEKPDVRDRDAEFSKRQGVTAAELSAVLDETISTALSVLKSVPGGVLTQHITVQKQDRTVLEAIYTAVEHFGEHTGQIIYMTKRLTQTDLGYYAHLNTRTAAKKS